jgi:hypothetical protein
MSRIERSQSWLILATTGVRVPRDNVLGEPGAAGVPDPQNWHPGVHRALVRPPQRRCLGLMQVI